MVTGIEMTVGWPSHRLLFIRRRALLVGDIRANVVHQTLHVQIGTVVIKHAFAEFYSSQNEAQKAQLICVGSYFAVFLCVFAPLREKVIRNKAFSRKDAKPNSFVPFVLLCGSRPLRL